MWLSGFLWKNTVDAFPFPFQISPEVTDRIQNFFNLKRNSSSGHCHNNLSAADILRKGLPRIATRQLNLIQICQITRLKILFRMQIFNRVCCGRRVCFSLASPVALLCLSTPTLRQDNKHPTREDLQCYYNFNSGWNLAWRSLLFSMRRLFTPEAQNERQQQSTHNTRQVIIFRFVSHSRQSGSHLLNY